MKRELRCVYRLCTRQQRIDNNGNTLRILCLLSPHSTTHVCSLSLYLYPSLLLPFLQWLQDVNFGVSSRCRYKCFPKHHSLIKERDTCWLLLNFLPLLYIPLVTIDEAVAWLTLLSRASSFFPLGTSDSSFSSSATKISPTVSSPNLVSSKTKTDGLGYCSFYWCFYLEDPCISIWKTPKIFPEVATQKCACAMLHNLHGSAAHHHNVFHVFTIDGLLVRLNLPLLVRSFSFLTFTLFLNLKAVQQVKTENAKSITIMSFLRFPILFQRSLTCITMTSNLELNRKITWQQLYQACRVGSE